MILSKSRKFVFLKGRKVAGTSLEIALSTICGPEDIITPIGPVTDELIRISMGAQAQNYTKDRAAEIAYIEKLKVTPINELGASPWPRGPYNSHMSLKKLIEIFGEVRGEYQIVCLDRNPYSKVLSLANMVAASNYKSSGSLTSTPETLKRTIQYLFATDEYKKVLNLRGYRGPDGKFDATLLRYENLEEDFSGLMATMGVAPPPPLPHAKKGLMANKVDPTEHFSVEQIRTINDVFSDEFELFGYTPISV